MYISTLYFVNKNSYKYDFGTKNDIIKLVVPSTRGEDDDDFNFGIRETEEDSGNLTCPICHLEFERTPENAQNLVAHVDEHLVEELKCPVCFITFNKSHQNAYENHVNVSRYHVCTSVINLSKFKSTNISRSFH